jgi:hypothetical protein
MSQELSNEERDDISYSLLFAIEDNEHEKIRNLISMYPWLKTSRMRYELKKEDGYTWMVNAGERSSLETIQLLVELGFNINDSEDKTNNTCLERALDENKIEMIEGLLKLGANPNFDRPAIAVLRLDDEDQRLPMMKLLVKYGLDVNKLYDLYGNMDDAFTVLDWASDPNMIAYLKSVGAKTSKELKQATTNSNAKPANTPPAKPATAPSPELAQVWNWFSQNVGKVDPKSHMEIVSNGPQITIHAVPPADKRKHLTLFTAGMSIKPMTLPKGEHEYQYAEIYVELPGDWDWQDMADPNTNWPMLWMRKMAQYVHNEQTWLGGQVALIANEEPPLPLAPNTKLSTLMLVADKSFKRTDGKTIHLYRMMPLYTEERQLEIDEGLPALFRALDRNSIPFIVDINRKNIGLK